MMWNEIRFGVRWRMRERMALAARGVNLENVKSVKISLDPFHEDTHSLRQVNLPLIPYPFSDNSGSSSPANVRRKPIQR